MECFKVPVLAHQVLPLTGYRQVIARQSRGLTKFRVWTNQNS